MEIWIAIGVVAFVLLAVILVLHFESIRQLGRMKH